MFGEIKMFKGGLCIVTGLRLYIKVRFTVY